MVKPIFTNKKKDKNKNKEKETDKNIEFLSKKRVVPDNPKEDVDMVKIKKQTNKIMLEICNDVNNNTNNLDILYNSLSRNYLLNEFTSNCLKYINKIIIDNQKNHLKKFQGIFELNKIFISTIKELLMNEFELILLSLYLELIDLSLSQDLISFKESFIFICYFIKRLTISEEQIAPINSFLNRKYQGFDTKFNIWFNSTKENLNKKFYFSYLEINNRIKEFNKPYSILCKKDYLDYNLIIDKILEMSFPYNEKKNESTSNKKSKKDKDFATTINDINIPKNNNIFENKNFLFNNSKNNITNNTNFFQNYIPNPNYIPLNCSGIFMNPNNNNINFGYINNDNNIFSSLNEEQINTNFVNNQNKEDENYKNKENTKLILPKKDNKTNSKMLFITQKTGGESDVAKNENKEYNELNINEIQNNNNPNIKVDNFITPDNLLSPKNLIEQNDQTNNQRNLNKQNSLNNNMIDAGANKNNNISGFSSNIFGQNIYQQQINDYSQLRYNPNLGINDINNPSLFSLSSFKQSYIDFNNFYNKNLQVDNTDNKLLLNQSMEDYFKSLYNINGMNSSKNFYPSINNYNNISKNNIPDNENNNIIENVPLNHILIENSVLPNLNKHPLNSLNQNQNNINQEKNNDENPNKNKN